MPSRCRHITPTLTRTHTRHWKTGNGILVAQRSSGVLKRFEWAGDASSGGGNSDDPPAGVIRESELGSASTALCKKEITQLAVIETHQFLVLLADELVKVAQLPTLQPVTVFEVRCASIVCAHY